MNLEWIIDSIGNRMQVKSLWIETMGEVHCFVSAGTERFGWCFVKDAASTDASMSPWSAAQFNSILSPDLG